MTVEYVKGRMIEINALKTWSVRIAQYGEFSKCESERLW